MEFSYCDLRNNLKGELKKVRADKGIINTVNYKIREIMEVESNVYLIAYKKEADQRLKGEPLLKYFIIDANKDE